MPVCQRSSTQPMYSRTMTEIEPGAERDEERDGPAASGDYHDSRVRQTAPKVAVRDWGLRGFF